MKDNKSNITSAINQLSEDKKRWFAVYTKYKCEKYIAEALSKKQIEVYLPIVEKTKRYSKKIKHFAVPLINCYVFVHIQKDEYIRTLETEYVLKFLKNGNDLIAIPESEINILKCVAGETVAIAPIGWNEYHAGEDVEVISGQLSGMTGKIVSKSGKRSFVIDLETIGYQLRIKVDFNLLRPMHAGQLTA
ncbi:MAG: UpxY family transcription antiterminator [Saprospiraceae bacterium]|nr:UpxY family transcription antiterminator [Saprospiraceae bacterium]